MFRISGPKALEISRKLTGENPTPREAKLVNLNCPDTEQLIDLGLVILFEGPASFTGEDVAEFHLHGSAAVEAALFEALLTMKARPAEAGEFTKRALENGKLDLAQVEALADLIDAETSEQRKQALGQLDGRLSAVAEGWRSRLLAILAPLEADVDFPDEDDVPAAVAARAGPAIDGLIGELKTYDAQSSAARAIRDGVSVAILGRPNAGKSSLLNHLAGSDVAIVSATPGTTRDVIEVRLDLGGVPVMLSDTAGIRDSSTDDIEIQGMNRALAKAEAAHIRVMVIDPLTDDIEPRDVSRGIMAALHPHDFVVWNKADLGHTREKHSNINDIEAFSLSAKTGEGVPAFLKALTGAVASLAHRSGDAALTRARHVEAVRSALDSLARAQGSEWRSPRNWPPKTHASPPALSVVLPAPSMWRMCWERFSPVSASGSRANGGRCFT